MKNKNTIIAIIMTTLLILAIILGIVAANKQKEVEETNNPDIKENEIIEENTGNNENETTENIINNGQTENIVEEQKEIEDLKNETGSKGDSKIYDVAKEYDGKKTLVVKPSIQFQTVLAGALKNEKPDENEVTKLANEFDYKNGVYITNQSRTAFINILNSCGITEFYINSEGYLLKNGETKSEISKQLDTFINNGKTYILDISGTCYMRDDVTGEIVEYPFEQMDPSEICEPFISGSNTLLSITTNKSNSIDALEILQTILQY